MFTCTRMTALWPSLIPKLQGLPAKVEQKLGEKELAGGYLEAASREFADRFDLDALEKAAAMALATELARSLRLRLLAHGRIAHGAMPEEGVNALAAMVRLLARVLELEAQVQREEGTHPLLGKPYITPTIARAPLSGDASQINCLPSQCDAYLDVRSLPSQRHADLIARIRALMDALQAERLGYRYELELIDDRPATEIARDHPLVQALFGAHQRVYGAAPAYGGVPGATDGVILARDRQIPVVVYGPGDKRIPHQPDEFVDLDEVERAARVYILAALAFFRAHAL